MLTDINGIALELVKKSIDNTSIHNLAVSSALSHYPGKVDTFDYVIIDLPKGRNLSRRWLMEAYLTLKLNGVLLLAGANDQGIQTVAHDGTDLFHHQSVIALKKGNRILRITGKKPLADVAAWCHSAGIYPGTWKVFETEIKGHLYQVKTLPGVFAADGLDPGTSFLLDHVVIKEQGRILDYGCGCGIIGLVIAKNSQAWIDMTDIDRYAIAAASENIRCFELKNGEAFYSDGLEAVMSRQYDQIITNPPFHSGKTIDYSMTSSLIAQSSNVLTRGGELWMVANKFIRYDRILKNHFSDFTSPVSNRQYSIWIARNR